MLTKTDIEKYFIAEKNESTFFIVFGIATLLIAICLYYFVKNNFTKGMAIPLITIALIQIVVGYTIFKRSDNDRIRVVYNLEMNPDGITKKELPRMQKVNKNFIVYKWIEIALIATSFFLLIKYKPMQETFNANFWFGFAVALLMQSSVMFVADVIAAKRGKFYEQMLNTWSKKQN